MTERLSSATETSACPSGKTNGLTIAVFVRSGYVPCAPHEAEGIALFARDGGQWMQKSLILTRPLISESPLLATAHIEDVAMKIENAQAVAGFTISGIAYRVLSRYRKHIFEIPELSQAELSGIAEDIALAGARRTMGKDAPQKARPCETDIEGVYALDLVTALEEFPELSSKMILKPFLQNTPFDELTLICRHMPGWLAQDSRYSVSQKQRGEYQVVTVRKAACREAML